MSIFIGSNFIPHEGCCSQQDPLSDLVSKLIEKIGNIVNTIFDAITGTNSDQSQKATVYKAPVPIPFSEKYAPKATPSLTIEEATEKLRVECQELKDDCRKIKADPEFTLEKSNPAIQRFIQSNDFLPASEIKLGKMTLEPAQAKGLMLGLKRDYDSARKSQKAYSRELPITPPCASTGAS